MFQIQSFQRGNRPLSLRHHPHPMPPLHTPLIIKYSRMIRIPIIPNHHCLGLPLDLHLTIHARFNVVVQKPNHSVTFFFFEPEDAFEMLPWVQKEAFTTCDRVFADERVDGRDAFTTLWSYTFSTSTCNVGVDALGDIAQCA